MKKQNWYTTKGKKYENSYAWEHVCGNCKFVYFDFTARGHNFCPNCGEKKRVNEVKTVNENI